MALSFQKDISETNLLNAFNNNIVEFNSDNSSDAYKCQILVNGDSYEITPNNNSFFFNFKSIFKKMIVDQFEDFETPSLDDSNLTTFIKDMSSVFLDVQISFIASFVNGDTETINRNVSIIQAATNSQDFRKRLIQNTDSFAVLGQLTEDSNRTFKMAYFEGYPFDVQVYNRNPSNVNVTNKTNLLDVTFNLPNKVNRIFFSDTETNVTIEDVLPLVKGVNELEFDTSQKTTIFLEKLDGGSGKYLKWKNHFGGWSYWLFEDKYQQGRNIDDLGYVNNDFENIDNINYIKNIGKESSDEISLNSIGVSPEYRLLLESLFDSPKVYLYMGEQFSKNEDADWLSVKLNNDSLLVKDHNNRWFDVSVQIKLPKRDTLML